MPAGAQQRPSAGHRGPRSDPRYADFAAVARYRQRAYLGVPLRDRQGRAQGAVAAVDTRARQWTAGDLTALQQLAELLGPQPERGASDDADTGGRKPGTGPVFARRSEFLNAVFDSLRTGVAVCDTDGRVVLINRAMQQVYGLTDGGGAAVWRRGETACPGPTASRCACATPRSCTPWTATRSGTPK